MSIFKACDIRGVYGQELDAATALLLGQAIGTRMQGKLVAVAGDLRISTPILLENLIRGLLRCGANVVSFGAVPTPVFYYGKDLGNAAAGVMVTASHNPKQYNGFKVILGNLPVIPEDLQMLAAEMEAKRFSVGQGTLQEKHIEDAYAVSLVNAFTKLRRRRIVVDAGNGSFWELAPRILKAVEQDVDPLYCTPDGTFPSRNPNPAIPEYLTALRQRIIEQKAELGVAFDGDGDRVVFADENGQVHPAERVLVLFIRSLLRHTPGAKVVYDLKSSSVVADEVLAAGGTPIAERSGHAFIKRRLMTESALLGGEVSGHFFFGDLGRDDALYAALLLLQVLDELNLSLSQAMATIPTYAITPDIRIPCPPDVAASIINELSTAFRHLRQDHLDGVRILFPTGWALARVSVTEPLLTLRFEAHTAKELAEIQRSVYHASLQLQTIWQMDTSK
ncbi:MAG: phosphomannomutase/phosphoglucomutase [Chloroflexi bacterium]|nr:phosphomannomutase/phosphoglucomutase [Chloroflexota bacterium]